MKNFFDCYNKTDSVDEIKNKNFFITGSYGMIASFFWKLGEVFLILWPYLKKRV